MPIRSAAPRVKSMTRPPAKGPRSLMRTTTARPFDIFSTLTRVPKGRLRCAAAKAEAFIFSPFAVRDPEPYQEALPHWLAASAWLPKETAVQIATAVVNGANRRVFIDPTQDFLSRDPHQVDASPWPLFGKRPRTLSRRGSFSG